jgi:DNA-binding IclR family transcriptional regulator
MVQSLERAFAILDAVAARPAGVTAIAEAVSLPKSTVARLLSSLEELGAVERVDGTRWRIGPAIAGFSGAASPERALLAAARPELVALVEALGEDAGLSLPDGYDVRYVDQVESDNAVQVRDWTGARAPLHAVPSGLVLLAEWPGDALEAYLAHPLVRLTPRTVTDPAGLRRRLGEVRERGHAWGYEEYAEGINSVAAPVRDGRGKPIAAVHVHGPAYRFPGERRAEAARAVAAAAEAVGRRLGR